MNKINELVSRITNGLRYGQPIAFRGNLCTQLSRYFLIPLTQSRTFDPCVKIFLDPTDQVKDVRSLCQDISLSHWPSQEFSILVSRYFLIPLTKSRIFYPCVKIFLIPLTKSRIFDPWSRYFLIPLTQSRIIDPCVKIFLDPTDQVKYFSIQFYLLFFSSIYYCSANTFSTLSLLR